MTQHDDRVSLLHMRDHAELIVELLGDREKVEILNDRFAVLAATRLFEILGAAANRVSAETQNQYPDLPWRDMIDMRNRLVHGYDTIDLKLVWDTAQYEIPELLDRLNDIIDERSREN